MTEACIKSMKETRTDIEDEEFIRDKKDEWNKE